MRQDFVEAEMAIAVRFREKFMQLKQETFSINDMLGIKIIGKPENLRGHVNILIFS